MKKKESLLNEIRAIVSYLRGRAMLKEEVRKRERRAMGWILPEEIQGKTGQDRVDVLDGNF